MKTALLAAVASAMVVQTATAIEKCNYSVVAPQLHSLGPEITTCYEATGYYLAPPPGPPTAAQQAGICSKCTAFIDRVKPMVWPDCTLNLAGTDQTLTAFFNSVISPCSATVSPEPVSTNGPPLSITPTPTMTSPTPTSSTGPSPTSSTPSTTAPTPTATSHNSC